MENIVKEARKVHIHKQPSIKEEVLNAIEFETEKKEEFEIIINVKINKKNSNLDTNIGSLLDITKNIIDLGGNSISRE